MKNIQDLEKKILYYKALYYQGRPEINDIEYDKLEEELRKLSPESHVLKVVGSVATGLDKVKHDKKMLSLDKTYVIDDLISWKGDHAIVSMFKIDGISCSILYEDGKFTLAKTRGDGSFGENITSKVQWISNVPQIISSKGRVEIRGELFCTEEDFLNLSNEMVSAGLEKPTSQRNIVAGLMGRKDHLELCRYIKFKAFDIIREDEFEVRTEMDKYHLLKKEKFDVLNIELHKDAKAVEKVIEEAREFMAEGEYQIDGLVFAYNDLALHSALGETAHHPRYKMAFKFQGESKTTIIEDIEWSVSRNGILTPVGIVKPVELSGAMISRVTLHNYGMVKQFELKKGDEIEIIRSGEVIPKFLSVVKASENKFERPCHCPSCGSEVFEVDIRLLCKNEECPAVVLESILNFVQKIGIDDISAKRLEEMINNKIIKNIPDLYRATEDDFLKLDKVKEKLATKFVTSIEKSKKVDLVKFLSALGISGGAINKCERVVNFGFNSIDKILGLTVEQLVMIDGFAEKSATDFIQSLQCKKELILELNKIGFNPSFEIVSAEDTVLKGQVFVITGTLSEKRSDIEKRIKLNGGKTASAVSSHTNFLVCNDKNSSSSKTKKAKELNIPIISEEELSKMFT